MTDTMPHTGRGNRWPPKKRTAKRRPPSDAKVAYWAALGDTDWQEFGACKGLDPGLFFPEQGGDVATPKLVCSGCVVRLECLEYALRTVQQFGVWGGTSERERRRIRVARNQQRNR